MPTRISSKTGVEKKHVHHDPKTQPSSQLKEIMPPRPTKIDLGGKVLGGGGKVLDDPHDVTGHVRIDQVFSLLADLPLDTLQVIEEFTPDHFADLLAALAEEYPRSHAKLTYLEKDKKLFVMHPSSVHEAFLVALTRTIGTFTSGIVHDNCDFNFGSSLNKSLFYFRADGSSGKAIPDYQLVMENNSDRAPGLPLIPKWIGEVSFTVPLSYTRSHLKQIVESQPTVDFAFMIRIEESHKWASPSRKDACTQKLRSQPFRAYNDFIPALPAGSLGPVVVEEFTWISISQVTFEAYLRRPNGHLVVDGDFQDDYSARGTLCPIIDMKNVDILLGKASDRLIQSLVNEMKASDEDAQAIEQVCRSEARLKVPWHIILRTFRSAVLIAAYERYSDWHRLGKRKAATTADSSRKKLRNEREVP